MLSNDLKTYPDQTTARKNLINLDADLLTARNKLTQAMQTRSEWSQVVVRSRNDRLQFSKRQKNSGTCRIVTTLAPRLFFLLHPHVRAPRQKEKAHTGEIWARLGDGSAQLRFSSAAPGSPQHSPPVAAVVRRRCYGGSLVVCVIGSGYSTW